MLSLIGTVPRTTHDSPQPTTDVSTPRGWASWRADLDGQAAVRLPLCSVAFQIRLSKKNELLMTGHLKWNLIRIHERLDLQDKAVIRIVIWFKNGLRLAYEVVLGSYLGLR